MVGCRACDLAYVDRPPAVATLAASYHAADYDSAEEAEDAADAYAVAVRPVLALLDSRVSALEIGTGTGAFLERLGDAGFTRLIGIEPSSAAIAAAPAHRRPWIYEGIFEDADVAPESLEVPELALEETCGIVVAQLGLQQPLHLDAVVVRLDRL